MCPGSTDCEQTEEPCDFDSLSKQYRTSDADAQEVLILKMGATKDPRALDFILNCIKDPQFKHRWQAAFAMAELADAGIADELSVVFLLGLLENEDWRDHTFGIVAFRSLLKEGIYDDRVLEPLFKIALTRKAALDARMGAISMLAELTRLASFTEIPTQRILGTFIRVLNEDNCRLKALAASDIAILASWGVATDEALPPLIRLLSVRDPHLNAVVMDAIGALAMVGIVDKKTIQPLKNKLKSRATTTIWDGNERVQTTVSKEARKALDVIKERTGWTEA